MTHLERGNMKIAFPIKENRGLESVLDHHFGMAEHFLIVDLISREYGYQQNQKLTSEESSCKTGIFKKSDKIDAVVTRCMGDGSQRNLNKADIRVYQAQKETVSENLDLMEKGDLRRFHMLDFCRNKKNKKEGGCGHHH